jgi:hypothetical protein
LVNCNVEFVSAGVYILENAAPPHPFLGGGAMALLNDVIGINMKRRNKKVEKV